MRKLLIVFFVAAAFAAASGGMIGVVARHYRVTMVPESQAAQVVPTQIVVAQSTLAATPVTINFTVPSDKIGRIVAAMGGLYPIPQIPDPEWVDPGDGSEAPMVDEFTGSQWAKEALRRLVRRDVARWERKVAGAAAVGAITEDDELLN